MASVSAAMLGAVISAKYHPLMQRLRQRFLKQMQSLYCNKESDIKKRKQSTCHL
jgi:hypothetical protein